MGSSRVKESGFWAVFHFAHIIRTCNNIKVILTCTLSPPSLSMLHRSAPKTAFLSNQNTLVFVQLTSSCVQQFAFFYKIHFPVLCPGLAVPFSFASLSCSIPTVECYLKNFIKDAFYFTTYSVLINENRALEPRQPSITAKIIWTINLTNSSCAGLALESYFLQVIRDRSQN